MKLKLGVSPANLFKSTKVLMILLTTVFCQVLPRAKARANPAGSKRNGPALLGEPNRPPQPANPIMEPEKCKAYIVYSIKECFARCKVPCLCILCAIVIGLIIAAVVGVKMALP